MKVSKAREVAKRICLELGHNLVARANNADGWKAVSGKVKRITPIIEKALVAARGEVASEALVKLRAIPFGHSHWDSTMMGGAGCELCIAQSEARKKAVEYLERAAPGAE